MYFERYLNDLDTFFMLLQTHFGTKLTERNSLIILSQLLPVETSVPHQK